MAVKTETHEVSSKDAGKRLDIFLSQTYKDISRSWLQKLIKTAHVQINGLVPNPRTTLKEGDQVTIELIDKPSISLEPEDITPRPTVVSENDDFIVVEKPAGIVVHPSAASPNGTLVNWLLLKYPEISGVGEDSTRPGIVHRLDKDTSGLMLVCRTQSSFNFFKEGFKERKISKSYTALVKGEMDNNEGSIMFPISRDPENPFKREALDVTYPLPQGAREAETYWAKIKSYSGLTLLEVIPKTGRTHQIRVHLAATGHPIVGDSLYRGPKLDGFSRIFLHASKLEFEGPSGKKHSFVSPLPHELEEVLNKLEE